MRRACVGAGALVVVLAVPIHPGFRSSGSTGDATVVASGVVPTDSDDDDSDSQRNTRCDPGYPEGVCVQSPTQSENNTINES